MDAYAFEVSLSLAFVLLLRLACVPPPNWSEVLYGSLEGLVACSWYLDHHRDVFCTVEFVILASIESHRGPICFTSLTEHLASLASAWSRNVCTVGGCLAPALTASAFVLSAPILRDSNADMGVPGHHLACQAYVFASSAFSGGDAPLSDFIFQWCFRIWMPQMSAVRFQ